MKEGAPRPDPKKPEKPLVGKSFDEVREVKKEFMKLYPNIGAVGIDIHETEEHRQRSIKVGLQKEYSPEEREKWPKEIDGVPVDYEFIGMGYPQTKSPDSAPSPASKNEQSPEEKRFIEDLITTGKAVRLKEGEKLPPGATHEIIEENGEIKVVRRRFSM